MLMNGTRHMIYEDPMTQQKPEGVATLVNRVRQNGGTPVTEDWEVCFDDGRCEADCVVRTIMGVSGLHIH